MKSINPLMFVDSDKVKSIENISKEIDEEYENENPDKAKISKLLWKQFMEGLEMSCVMNGKFNKRY